MTTNGIDTPALADLTPAGVKKLRVPELRDLCIAEGLPSDGNKADLVKKLISKKHRGDRGYVAGKTLCKHCGAPVRVRGTSTEQLEPGKIAVRRHVKCSGRRAHTYEIVEIVEEGGR